MNLSYICLVISLCFWQFNLIGINPYPFYLGLFVWPAIPFALSLSKSLFGYIKQERIRNA